MKLKNYTVSKEAAMVIGFLCVFPLSAAWSFQFNLGNPMVVLAQTENGKWLACGPVQCLQISEETRDKAFDRVTSRGHGSFESIGQIGRCNYYQSNASLKAGDYSPRKVSNYVSSNWNCSASSGSNDRTGGGRHEYRWRNEGSFHQNVIIGQCSEGYRTKAICNKTNLGQRVLVGGGSDVEWKPIGDPDTGGNGQGYSGSLSQGGRVLTWTGAKTCGIDQRVSRQVTKYVCSN